MHNHNRSVVPKNALFDPKPRAQLPKSGLSFPITELTSSPFTPQFHPSEVTLLRKLNDQLAPGAKNPNRFNIWAGQDLVKNKNKLGSSYSGNAFVQSPRVLYLFAAPGKRLHVGTVHHRCLFLCDSSICCTAVAQSHHGTLKPTVAGLKKRNKTLNTTLSLIKRRN